MTDKGVAQAVLDVAVAANSGRVAVDVSAAFAPPVGAATGRARARAGGLAAREREQENHRRYLGPGWLWA
eukprot:3314076-Alexandrium_andersonii.AAC.1